MARQGFGKIIFMLPWGAGKMSKSMRNPMPAKCDSQGAFNRVYFPPLRLPIMCFDFSPKQDFPKNLLLSFCEIKFSLQVPSIVFVVKVI